MRAYVAFAAPDIAQDIRRHTEGNRPDDLRVLQQRVDASDRALESWLTSVGGSFLQRGGGEGLIELPAEKLGEFPGQRGRYARDLGARVAAGVGMKAGEAAMALRVAHRRGGDRIVLHQPGIEKELELQKAQPGMNAGPGAGFGGFSRGADVAPPAAPQVEGSEHSDAEAAISAAETSEMPPAPERTHAAQDLVQQLHELAQRQNKDDAHEQAEANPPADPKYDEIRAKVAQVLKGIKERAPELAQMRQQSPENFAALMQMVQAVIAMARALPGGPVQKSLRKDEQADQMHDMVGKRIGIRRWGTTEGGRPSEWEGARLFPATVQKVNVDPKTGRVFSVHAQDEMTGETIEFVRRPRHDLVWQARESPDYFSHMTWGEYVSPGNLAWKMKIPEEWSERLPVRASTVSGSWSKDDDHDIWEDSPIDAKGNLSESTLGRGRLARWVREQDEAAVHRSQGKPVRTYTQSPYFGSAQLSFVPYGAATDEENVRKAEDDEEVARRSAGDSMSLEDVVGHRGAVTIRDVYVPNEGSPYSEEGPFEHPGTITKVHIDEQHPEKRAYAVHIYDEHNGETRLYARVNDGQWHEVESTPKGDRPDLHPAIRAKDTPGTPEGLHVPGMSEAQRNLYGWDSAEARRPSFVEARREADASGQTLGMNGLGIYNGIEWGRTHIRHIPFQHLEKAVRQPIGIGAAIPLEGAPPTPVPSRRFGPDIQSGPPELPVAAPDAPRRTGEEWETEDEAQRQEVRMKRRGAEGPEHLVAEPRNDYVAGLAAESATLHLGKHVGMPHPAFFPQAFEAPAKVLAPGPQSTAAVSTAGLKPKPADYAQAKEWARQASLKANAGPGSDEHLRAAEAHQEAALLSGEGPLGPQALFHQEQGRIHLGRARSLTKAQGSVSGVHWPDLASEYEGPMGAPWSVPKDEAELARNSGDPHAIEAGQRVEIQSRPWEARLSLPEVVPGTIVEPHHHPEHGVYAVTVQDERDGAYRLFVRHPSWVNIGGGKIERTGRWDWTELSYGTLAKPGKLPPGLVEAAQRFHEGYGHVPDGVRGAEFDSQYARQILKTAGAHPTDLELVHRPPLLKTGLPEVPKAPQSMRHEPDYPPGTVKEGGPTSSGDRHEVGRRKVQHGDGSQSWVQSRAGQVTAVADRHAPPVIGTAGHPISSRNQSGR